jgi:hypothetical protein
MLGAFSGAGLNGPLALPLATAITLGLSQAFNTLGQYSGVVAGVGVGSDISKIVVANAPSLVGMLEVTLRAAMGPGAALSLFTTGLGTGIASLLLLGTGMAPITGATAGIPAAGSSTSVVV